MTAILCVCGMMISLFSGCTKESKSEDKGENLPKIIIGTDTYPPYNYIDADGEVIGIDVDLAREAFHRMGYQAEFEWINWEEKKSLLADGKIDCIWDSFTMTGREDEYRWAGPYMLSRQVIAVNKDSDIQNVSDLEDKVVAVQSTTKPEDIFRNHADPKIPQLREVISVQNRELIYTFLSKGYADAVAAHETAILQYMSDYNLEYRILDEPLLEVGLGAAFDINDERGLDQKLNKTFDEMRKDGTTEKIIGKYLENPEKYLDLDKLEVNTHEK